MIPNTLWLVFSNRWLDASQAPADAADWLSRGYITLVPQGKLDGYAIAPLGYRLIVGG